MPQTVRQYNIYIPLNYNDGSDVEDWKLVEVEGNLFEKWVREGKEQVVKLPRIDDYTIIIRPDDNDTFVAYIPAIKGCHAWGRTAEEAQAELKNVFDMIKEEYEGEGKHLPADVKDIKVVVDASS